MRRSDLNPALLVLIALGAYLRAERASTDSVKLASEAKGAQNESLSENEMAKILSDLDLFYSMDFAVSLPVLENYEVVESTAPLSEEEK